MRRYTTTTTFLLALSTPAIAAPIDAYFRGSLAFEEDRSRNIENTVSAVDLAIRSLLEGSSISGRFTVDPNTPLKDGTSTAPGELAEYEDASTDLEITVDGNRFVDDDPSSCRAATDSFICDVRQSNDVGPFRPVDTYIVLSDLATSDDLARAIEAESGVSASVTGPSFSILIPVVGDVSYFAGAFDLFATTDLASPFDVPVEARRMTFGLGIFNNFVIEDRVGLPRYQFVINDLEVSPTPFLDPLTAVPLPAGFSLLASGLAFFIWGAARRRPGSQCGSALGTITVPKIFDQRTA
ncbi:MAG: hypothetical protein AAF665_16530 [Pseudomonadota bacterium]